MTVFSDNYASLRSRGCWAQHGFGAFLEFKFEDLSLNVVFDCGPSVDIVKHNLDLLKLDFSGVNAVFLSHGHYDHTGGLIEVVKRIGRRVPVVVHPKTFSNRFAKRDLRVVGVPFKPNDVESAGGIVVQCRNPIDFGGKVFLSGEIERVNDFEKVEGYVIEEGDRLVDDNIIDDRALIANLNGEFIVLTGCAHSGLINTLHYAMKEFNARKFKAIIGGFHLESASNELISRTVGELRKIDFQYIVPMHCTGIKMTAALINSFGEKVKVLGVGESLELK